MRRAHRPRVALAALLLVACRSPEATPVEHGPVALDATQRSVLEQFVGAWRHAGGTDEQQAALDAVSEVTAQMNGLIRGMAQSRLEPVVRIDATVTIDERDGVVTFIRSDRPDPFTAPADGNAFELQTSDGDEARGSLRIDGPALITLVETDSGGGERTYRIDAQGVLEIVSRTFSPQLPGDVITRATYARP